MSVSPELAPPKVRWDLSFLFSGLDDPKIEAVWTKVMADADAFAAKYRGKIGHADPATLAQSLNELEALYQDVAKPLGFANLLFTADSSDPAISAFMQKQMERGSELSIKLMFFELEIQGAPDAVIEAALASDQPKNFHHYLRVARTFSENRLSESEEVIIEETANTGGRAWQRLFEEVTSNMVLRVVMPNGEVQELSESETLALLRHSDRAVRQAAADGLSAGLKENERVLVFIYNTLLQDKSVDDRLRKYRFPEESRHKSNELTATTVDLVIRLCRENYGLVERFYNVKRDILGYSELTHVDRYAPLNEAAEQVDWDRARKIINDSFGKFSSTLAERADEFFAKGWIDAEPRKGKQGGAFCSYNTPDTHPVVFMNYMNKMDDVMTLAHELGHGVHASLSRDQSYFNFHGTLPLAELASTFGEMLVFETLVAGASTQDKLALYGEKIEGIFATVFRQAAMYQFEKACHKMRREEGELTPDDFGDLWQTNIQEMFGSSIKLGDQHRSWWSYVSHFIGMPFYVYAYSFGELLVLSLYQMAKKEGPSFADKYEKLLRLGGSQSPKDLMATVDVDLESEAFWKGGFAAMESLIVEFERLWSEVK